MFVLTEPRNFWQSPEYGSPHVVSKEGTMNMVLGVVTGMDRDYHHVLGPQGPGYIIDNPELASSLKVVT